MLRFRGLSYFTVCICLFFSASIGLRAEKSDRSTWILLVGKSEHQSWWTMRKLRNFTKDERYNGSIALTELLKSAFDGVGVLVDINRLSPAPLAEVDIVKEKGMNVLVESILTNLFVREKIGIQLEMPLSESCSLSGSNFLYESMVITFSADHPGENFLRGLTHKLYCNKKKILGDAKRNIEIPRAMGDLAKVWEKELLEDVSDVSVTYSEILGTFFFTMPRSSDECFYNVCESILSGNR